MYVLVMSRIVSYISLNFGIAACILTVLHFWKKHCGGPVCFCRANLHGKFVIVTGGTSGIGFATATELAKRGAKIVFTCRDLSRGAKARKKIIEFSRNKEVFCEYLDLNDFSSVYTFVETVLKVYQDPIHLLINNAGTFFHPKQKTIDGFDVTFQTNYLGTFLLTELLIPKLTIGSRVLFLSSHAHFMSKKLDVESLFEYNPESLGTSAKFLNYSRSKLCLLLYSKVLATRIRNKGVSVYSIDPGSVETSIYRHFPFLQNPFLRIIQKPIRYIVIRNPFQGSQTVIHCALSSTLLSETGLYYSDLKAVPSSPLSNNSSTANLLFQLSLKFTGLLKHYGPTRQLDPTYS